LALDSDPGDYIGQGRHDVLLQPPGYSFEGYATATSVQVWVRSPDSLHVWSLTFAVPSGSVIGSFENAVRMGMGGDAGLDVDGEGRGCNTLDGSFTVRQLEYASNGTVTKLDAVFEQHCDRLAPALRGEIAINADDVPAAADLSLHESAAAGAGGTAVYSIGILNESQTDSNTVTVTHSIPAGATVVSATAGNGWCYVGATTVTCELGSLPPGRYIDAVTLVLRAASPQTWSTHAEISTLSDPNAANDAVDLSYATDPSATVPRGLTFSSRRDLLDQIYATDVDGSNPTNLSAYPANDLGATWSHDGSRVAFSRTVDGNSDVYVMNADGTGLRRLTTDPGTDENPSWGPDDRIAFDSDRAGNFDVYTMYSDGTGVTRLTTGSSYDDVPSWSPNGNQIAFDSDRDGNEEIYIMNADGTGQRNVTHNPADDLSRPGWSQDGSRLVFTSYRSGNADVWTIGVDGSNPVQLTTDPGGDGDPAWSPDGAQIAFQSNRSGSYEIYVMNADGSHLARVTNNDVVEHSVSWRRSVVELSWPALIEFSPASGPPGTVVTFRGGNLSYVDSVTLCNVSASFTIVDDSHIQAVVPQGACDDRWRARAPGGIAGTETFFHVTAGGAPVVTTALPASGAAGATVTLTGSALLGVTSVTVCYVPATFTVDSDTQITAVVPANACEGRWRVSSPAGTGMSSTLFTPAGQQPAQSTGPPLLSGMSPSSAAVGASVTLTGSGFTGASSVTVCYVPASFTVDSDTQLTATVPVGACDGRWRVTNAHGEGASSTVFTVSSGQQPPPQQQSS
jgi:uncharacterized repeat protein (TIGR01451 family)